MRTGASLVISPRAGCPSRQAFSIVPADVMSVINPEARRLLGFVFLNCCFSLVGASHLLLHQLDFLASSDYGPLANLKPSAPNDNHKRLSRASFVQIAVLWHSVPDTGTT